MYKQLEIFCLEMYNLFVLLTSRFYVTVCKVEIKYINLRTILSENLYT